MARTEIEAALFSITELLTHEESHRIGLLKYGDGNHHTGSEDGFWASEQIWGNLKGYEEYESHTASEKDLEQELLNIGATIVHDPNYDNGSNNRNDNSDPFKHLWGVY